MRTFLTEICQVSTLRIKKLASAAPAAADASATVVASAHDLRVRRHSSGRGGGVTRRTAEQKVAGSMPAKGTGKEYFFLCVFLYFYYIYGVGGGKNFN